MLFDFDTRTDIKFFSESGEYNPRFYASFRIGHIIYLKIQLHQSENWSVFLNFITLTVIRMKKDFQDDISSF